MKQGAASIPVVVVLAMLVVVFRSAAQPDNDLFVNSQELFGTNITGTAYNLDATMEPGEPNHAAPYGGQAVASVWYHWTAPRSGFLNVYGYGPTVIYSAIGIYTGDSITALTPVKKSLEGQTGSFPVQAGQTYQIAFSSRRGAYSPSYGIINYELTFTPPIQNDDFANSIQLTANDYNLRWSNIGATTEPGEPQHGGYSTSNSVWWRWTAPADGTIHMSTYNYAFQPVLAIYQGDSVSNLTAKISNGGPGTDIALQVYSGETYHICVASRYGSWGEFNLKFLFSTLHVLEPTNGASYQLPTNVVFRFSLPNDVQWQDMGFLYSDSFPVTNHYQWVQPAPNHYRIIAFGRDARGELYLAPPVEFDVLPRGQDAFADRIVLEGTNILAASDARGATAEPGEPLYAGEYPAPSVWWTWTAPISGRVVLDALPETIFIRTEPFIGDTVSNLTAVPYDFYDFSTARGGFRAVAGQTYQLRSMFVGGESGPFQFRLQMVYPPANDNFANARVITSASFSDQLPDWSAATREPGEPQHGHGPGTLSVWYRWSAPANGRITIHANTVLSVYTGSSLTNLQRVFGPDSDFNLLVTRGVTYHIGIDGSGEPRPLSFGFQSVLGSSNDQYSAAAVLSGAEGTIAGNNEFATTQPWEPGKSRSLWYSWTAPGPGVLDLWAETNPGSGYAFNPRVQVFTGTTPATLTNIATGNPTAARVQSGVTYHISVDGNAIGPSSDFSLHWKYHPKPGNDNFSNREPISGAPVVFYGANWKAGREPGEPAHGGMPSGRSIWWTWQAPTDGFVQLWASNAFHMPWVGAYVGRTLTNLILVSQYNELSNSGVAAFSVSAGTRYHFAADIPLDQNPATFLGMDLAMRLDLTTLVFVSPKAGVAYYAPTGVVFSLNTPAPEFDGTITNVKYFITDRLQGITSPSIGTASSPPFSVLVPNISPGWYEAAAIALNDQGIARFVRPELFKIRPINDHFEKAWIISGHRATLHGTTAAATRQPGEPPHSGSNSAASVWFRWTAPATAQVNLSAGDGLFVPKAYQGTNLASLRLVPGTAGRGSYSFLAKKGATYQIAVESPLDLYYFSFNFLLDQPTLFIEAPAAGTVYTTPVEIPVRVASLELGRDVQQIDFRVDNDVFASTSAAPLAFTWQNVPAGKKTLTARALLTSGESITSAPVRIIVLPKNDSFASHEQISGTEIIIRDQDLSTATWQTGEPESLRGIWYSWRAPGSGLLSIFTDAALWAPPEVRLLRGPNASNLTQVPRQGLPTQWVAAPSYLVDSNVLYFIFFGAITQAPNPADIRIKFWPVSANDAFANRIPLVGTNLSLQSSSLLATGEPGEPQHGNAAITNSVWWTWTAPTEGLLHIALEPTAPYTEVAIYTGNALANLSRLPPYPSPLNPIAGTFPVDAGATYQIALNELTALAPSFNWALTFVPTNLHIAIPTNDNFADRISLPVDGASFVTVNSQATKESGEPDHGGFPGGRSLWWSWTTPVAGLVTVAVTDARFTPVIAVYTGDTLSELTSVTNGLGDVRFRTLADITYQIAIDSRFGSTGSFTAALAIQAPPANDFFANRYRILGAKIAFSGMNVLATREFHEPLHASAFGGRSVWYAWSPPVAGHARITLDDGIWRSLIAVYLGNVLTNLTPVTGSVGTASNAVEFVAYPNQDYAIAIDGADGFTGKFNAQFALDPLPPPSLDISRDPWQLSILSSNWQSTILESSPDLQTWHPILTNLSDHIVIQLDLSSSKQFFRAFSVP